MGARRPVSRGHHTAAAIAACLQRSARTIRNYVAEPRADYETRSLERIRPWVALGMSRRTWYRRRQKGEFSRRVAGDGGG
jgi:hypothetical protein